MDRHKTQTGDTILLSGRNDDQHHGAVALILRKRLRISLIEWKSVNERVIYARFKGKQVNMSIIQCYAPMINAEDKEKETFYSSVQAEVEKISRHNAKVG